MSPPCRTPISFEELIAYHVGELGSDEAERVEAHYFGCVHCSERLEVMSLLDRGVSDLVRRGGLMASSTMAMVDRARAQGIVVREYRTDPGEHVDCTGAGRSIFFDHQAASRRSRRGGQESARITVTRNGAPIRSVSGAKTPLSIAAFMCWLRVSTDSQSASSTSMSGWSTTS